MNLDYIYQNEKEFRIDIKKNIRSNFERKHFERIFHIQMTIFFYPKQ